MITDLSIQEFYDRATAMVRAFRPTCTIDVTEKNSLRLKARIGISLSIFMDVFYSVRTRRTSIAVILKGKRVFGIDNLGGWHVHPIRENQVHRSSKQWRVAIVWRLSGCKPRSWSIYCALYPARMRSSLLKALRSKDSRTT